MAWPCISRVCCLARLWGQRDTSDLALPLTGRGCPELEEAEAADGGPRASGPLPAGPPASQDSRPAPRRGPPAPPASPPRAETQYRRDFRAWPPQKRGASPWAGRGEGPPVYVLPAGGQRPPPAPSPPGTTCYRQEYRPWTGAKPSKPIKTKQRFIIPEDHFMKETSYRADFKIHEAKTKFSPNPSAVFQAPSRILNI
ncbi:MAP6 domain-containing protein 1 [Carettochelys insculpta]|uniref:MAP6 domain-containing protein 1 n=1 Tax=Carettochelys insculpta TaxID=44489 RepID=UPI003EBB3FF7